jgi:hypothetical protein
MALEEQVLSVDNFSVDSLTERFRRAKHIKDLWTPKFEECYEYAFPQRESFYAQEQAQTKTDKIFDETAVVGLQEFASRLQSGLVPNYARWAELVSGSEIPDDQRSDVDLALEQVTNYIFEIIQNSNFSQEVHESFLDLAIGTGCIQITEGDALNPVIFTTIPLTQLYIDVGPDDRIDAVFRERAIRSSKVKVAYPKATLPAKINLDLQTGKDVQLNLIDCTYRIYDSPEEKYQRMLFDPVSKDLYYQETYVGTGSNPFVPFRWSKAAGEVFGRGPLLNAMPAIKTCNLTVQLILENAQMAISGMYQVEDDGVLNVDTIQIVPGTLIPIAPGSSGLKNITSTGNFDVAQLILSDMRMNIKKALYNDMLGNPDKTPMSATEVSQRMADLSRQIGAAFGRLQAELVNPVLRRVVYILKKQGRISIPTINGREIKVRATSPLSQAQSQQDIVHFDRFIEMIGVRFGPQLVNMLIKTEDAAKYLGDKFGIPERLLRSDEERAMLMNRLTQQLQQNPQMDGQLGGQQTPPIAGA